MGGTKKREQVLTVTISKREQAWEGLKKGASCNNLKKGTNLVGSQKGTSLEGLKKGNKPNYNNLKKGTSMGRGDIILKHKH